MLLANDDYDAVPYPGASYPETHPGRLAVMGLLHGLNPAPVERCRVLEVGCNDAANLIPMAYVLPRAEFIGFDLAALPIARARLRIDDLGLTNIRVFQGDVIEVVDNQRSEPELGLFDYIIAHGVYAWVPEGARDSLLALCRKHLAENGIAYISYNALPGGHIRNLVADILLQTIPYAGEAAPGDSTRTIGNAIEFLDFVIGSRPEGDPYRALLEKEAKQIQRKGSQALYHDEIATFHRPVSFSSFVDHAAKHGLQYLSDSMLPSPKDPCYQPRVMTMVKGLAKGDRIAEEQILDYVRMKMYRETLLCRAECAVDSAIRLEAFERLRLSTQAESRLEESMPVFVLPGGLRMESQHPPTILLMDYLIALSPRFVPMVEVKRFLEENGVSFDTDLLTLLLRLVVSRMIRLEAWDAPVASRIPDRPVASAVSRQEAAVQSSVTSLLHTTLRLDDAILRDLLTLLDGTRDHDDLLKALRTRHPEMTEDAVSGGIAPSLRMLQRMGVLLAEAVHNG